MAKFGEVEAFDGVGESPTPKKKKKEERCGCKPSVEAEEEWLKINVSSGTWGDEGMTYFITPSGDFGPIYRETVFRLDTTPPNILLTGGNRDILPHETAEAVGLLNGERLHVKHCLELNFNCNIHLKQVTVRTLEKDPLKMTIKVPLAESIEDLYRSWAMFVDYKMGTFYLVHEKVRIEMDGTVTTIGLRNDVELFSVPNGLPAVQVADSVESNDMILSL